MAAYYASYQDDTPDSPPPAAAPFHDGADAEQQQQQRPGVGAGFGNELGADERGADPYTTSLPLRIEIEALLAYAALPPAGPAALLLLEHKNDYVRFHAWQASLVFTCLFVFHIIFSFTKVVSFLLLAGDLVLMAFLGWHAWHDAETLERFELPWFGRMASNFVDSE